jgi:7-dehydrocholesterol reductase
MGKKIRTGWGPLFLIFCCPPAVMIFWYTNTVLKGSFIAFWDKVATEGFLQTLYAIWSPYFFGTPAAWWILSIFACVQLIFMKYLPGKSFNGPPTPKGNIPVYKANGVSAYLATLFLFWSSTSLFHLFPATILYDHLGGILGALNLFSLFYCFFLYFKGRFAPSSTDCGTTGHFIFDYYWGTELYPRLFGWDLKMFTNCRFGMMGWGLLLLSYAAKQKELYGLSDSMVVSVILQFVYLTKFFFWEKGYLRSLDIMHDRAGFYICWGCLVWVPCIYTSPAMYLVHHPNHLGFVLAASIVIIGSTAILTNYWADRQRYFFRQKEGECRIWGKKPEYTVAYYETTAGQTKKNLLLASGWWGIARHFHYVPELIGTLCWTLPALFTNFLPFFYVCFLTVLLFDRALRDDKRCAEKYGADWLKHCQKVPYRILPFLY